MKTFCGASAVHVRCGLRDFGIVHATAALAGQLLAMVCTLKKGA